MARGEITMARRATMRHELLVTRWFLLLRRRAAIARLSAYRWIVRGDIEWREENLYSRALRRYHLPSCPRMLRAKASGDGADLSSPSRH